MKNLRDNLNINRSVLESLYCYERDNCIELSMIEIKEEFRNQGFGSEIMRKICTYADSVQKPILCSPEPHNSNMSLESLVSFYEKLGFVPNKGSIRDYSLPSHSYRRNPE